MLYLAHLNGMLNLRWFCYFRRYPFDNYGIKINDFNLTEARIDYDFIPPVKEESLLSDTLTE